MKTAVLIQIVYGVMMCLLTSACGQSLADPKPTQATVKSSLEAIAVKVFIPESLTNADGRLLLRFEGVTFRGQQFSGLRLFLNKPGVNASTPKSDPSYLDSISPGHFNAKKIATDDFEIDISNNESAVKAVESALKHRKLSVYCVPILRQQSTNSVDEVSAITIRKAAIQKLSERSWKEPR